MINIAEKAGKSIMDVMIHNSTIILIDGCKLIFYDLDSKICKRARFIGV